jgi:hypothetical protein
MRERAGGLAGKLRSTFYRAIQLAIHRATELRYRQSSMPDKPASYRMTEDALMRLNFPSPRRARE